MLNEKYEGDGFVLFVVKGGPKSYIGENILRFEDIPKMFEYQERQLNLCRFIDDCENYIKVLRCRKNDKNACSFVKRYKRWTNIHSSSSEDETDFKSTLVRNKNRIKNKLQRISSINIQYKKI